MVDNPPTVISHIESGRLRPLAVAAKQRMALLPDVPTAAEAGVANYEASSWFGVAAPAGTPAAIVDRLHREIVKAVRARPAGAVREIGRAPGRQLASRFAAQIRAERQRWGEIIKAANIKAE